MSFLPRILALSALLAGASHATTVTIGGFTHDLGQFTGANVTVSLPGTTISGKQWDNAVGVDNYTLGELATAQYGFDPGDTVALGSNTRQDSLKLTYGSAFKVGTGAEKYFVVYELKSVNNFTPDLEGTAFEISFNGGAWVSALNYSQLNVVGPNEYHHQVVFDLTDSNFNFNVGSMINVVDIRSRTGLGTSSDPDFTFAAHAMNVGSVPDASATMALLVLSSLGVFGFRKRFSVR
jgi:hypothetical protein